jgi:hypothetical protein
VAEIILICLARFIWDGQMATLLMGFITITEFINMTLEIMPQWLAL